ncbi:Hint domain-containing protein [Celeribacter arenosi]|uniref:Hedgehog/Intein (Hint) domain-containing protein n=1 Tax=Celeribacter arenosi TaxID=792649 RepID=A0ABP7JU13_9RHOB
MATINLRGYLATSFWTTSGSPTVVAGDAVRLDPTYDNDTDYFDLSIDDDDTVFDSDHSNPEVGSDSTQTGTAHDSAGCLIASGNIYIEEMIVLTDGAGNTVRLYVIEVDGVLLGVVSDPEVVPGTTYEVVSVGDPEATGESPDYSTFSDPTFDVDDGNVYTGGANADVFDTGAGDDTVNSGAGADTIHAGDGHDTIIYGTGGATQAEGDTVYGGDGVDYIDDIVGSAYTYDDTLYGEGGDDIIYAGGGEDYVDGGTGDDRMYGEDGDDEIYGRAGADTIQGDAGTDQIYAGDDNDWADGGSGNDQVYGEGGDDTLLGGTGDDNLHGGEGDDTFIIYETDDTTNVFGDAGNDTVDFREFTPGSGVTLTATGTEAYTYAYGNSGAIGTINTVEIFSGTESTDWFDVSSQTKTASYDLAGGDDTFIGSDAGEDISGGTGNDTITTGGGNDTIYFSDGDGHDTITDFDMGDTDADGFTNDQLDVSNLRDAQGNLVSGADVVVSDDGAGNAVLTFPNGESITLIGVAPTQVDHASELYAMGVPCFASGTRIETPSGARLVQDLRPGDRVVVADGHSMEILWHGQRHVTAGQLAARPELAPVLIRDGAIGNRGDLVLSAQHALYVDDDATGAGRFLRAVHLARHGSGAVRIARGKRGVTYHHLLLPRHAVVFANGVPSESLYPGRFALNGFDDAARAELFSLFPALDAILSGGNVSQIYGRSAVPYLRADAARRVARELCV